MKVYYSFVASIVLTVLSFGQAQDYEWRDVVQQVEIRADGTVYVHDERTFVATEGTFRNVFLCIDLLEGQTLTPLSIGVEEGGLANPVGSLKRCREGGPKNQLHLSFDEPTQQTRVNFVYEIGNGLSYYRDVVLWNWIVLEPEHPTIRGYDLSVRSPSMFERGRYDVFAEGFANSSTAIQRNSDQRSFQLQRNTLNNGESVRLRYLMQPEAFAEKGTEAKLDTILATLAPNTRPAAAPSTSTSSNLGLQQSSATTTSNAATGANGIVDQVKTFVINNWFFIVIGVIMLLLAIFILSRGSSDGRGSSYGDDRYDDSDYGMGRDDRDDRDDDYDNRRNFPNTHDSDNNTHGSAGNDWDDAGGASYSGGDDFDDWDDSDDDWDD